MCKNFELHIFIRIQDKKQSIKYLNFVFIYRHDSGTMDFRNRAFGTIKWTIGNKVACEFLGSRNFALEGKAGVYKNAELAVNYHL